MNYLETMKNIVKNKERRVQNLILLVVLLVIILICANFLFSSKQNEQNMGNNTSTNTNINNSTAGISKTNSDTMEEKLSVILSQISGISDVSVVLSYSKESRQNLAYNVKETEKEGEKTSEKSVAYNEQGNNKTAIIETIEMPKVEGAIVVAKGADTVEIRSKIASAISNLTNVPVYKVQVFEKNG